MNRFRWRLPGRWSFVRSGKVVAFAAVLCVATVMLVVLGYQATREARRSTRLLLERRVAEQIALLSAGLGQDMRGAHATVLVPVTPDQLVLDPPYDLADAFARGFARFPYPEFFFTWNESANGEVTYLFTRADRPPGWHGQDLLSGPYPVDVARNAPAVHEIVGRARQEAARQRPVALFDATIGGVVYQVVVAFLRSHPGHVSGVIGFGVNLEWVRASYFEELVFQIARIGGAPDEMSLEILDAGGRVVTSTRPRHPGISHLERRFPLVFVDRALLGALPWNDAQDVDTWTARVGVARDNPLAVAQHGLDARFVLIAFAALATVAGLTATVRGVRVAATLAAMKSDFVSTVTHELKTPLAVIRLIADTLAQGRYESPVTIRDYSALLRRETANLGRLIDNLLAYARLGDVSYAYSFEAVEVAELVDRALQHFQALLAEQRFAVEVTLPAELPPVRVDRSAAVLALENLIDNAIKYSESTCHLAIRAAAVDARVAISVADRGIGIPADEIVRVSDKFFRGRNAKRGGSGLGLAIVRQVVDAHGGRLSIHSTIGSGTRVEIAFPMAAGS